MSISKFHAEWLSLLEISGPFLSLPVLKKVFPQGLDPHDSDHFRVLRQVHEEWDANQHGDKPDPAIHTQWIKWVLRNTLELDEVLVEGQDIPQTLKAEIEEPQHRETLRPDMVVMGPDNKARLLVQWYPLSQRLGRTVEGKPWKASPDTRMTQLLRDSGVAIGLITNGDQWMLVYAPPSETSGYASWYSTLWLEEKKTLAAFRTLLSLHRFFGVPDEETLVPLLAESASTQQEVTDQLGSQVRSAVEILIQSLDRADQDYGRELLAKVPEEVLYEAALTVMMRLVFLFCAEERELLLLGDQLFDQHYAVSTLVAQLQNTADQHGEAILERRLDAWCRLLSTFRAVYGGVNHDRMHLPAYSGNLFDPDRFPFLEGRKSDTSWRDAEANPLPINNRTVLHLLRSLQYLEMHGEAQRLSFRALDIEQIGHVYEGLLDHTAKRSTEPVLGLVGKHEPETPLAELEEQRAKGDEDFFDFLKKETGSGRKWENYIDQQLDNDATKKLRSACGNDEKLFERVLPFAKLVRNDTFDRPVVIGKNSFYVTAGTDRRSSGTHYTPRSLTEPIVKHTLEPLVYEGPAEGKPRDEWKLKSPKELLDLKICDMACGSGAFLVQAARYMAECLLEAWETIEKASPDKAKITPFGETSTGEAEEQFIPDDSHERVVYARRIVSQRCIYGVDLNPLATEMAKLSLWLLTLAKDKPFTFLNHSIRTGDSLVGICDLDQLLRFSLTSTVATGPLLEQQRGQIENRINATKLLRNQIEELPSNTPESFMRKSRMLENAESQTKRLSYACDVLLAESWKTKSNEELESHLNARLVEVSGNLRSQDYPTDWYVENANTELAAVGIANKFHWPLEFPEVFMGKGGFAVVVCNPPFQGGKRITGALGVEYRNHIIEHIAEGKKGNSDLCAYFMLRAADLLCDGGQFGIITTNTIAEGDTREVGLDQLVASEIMIPRAVRSCKWPGSASLEIAQVWGRKGCWDGDYWLDGRAVSTITPYLTSGEAVTATPNRLLENAKKSFIGTVVYGQGFVLTQEQGSQLLQSNAKNRDVVLPYINGDDLNSTPDQSPTRYVIKFDGRSLQKAKEYVECFEIVEREVKPYRMTVKEKKMKEKWWLHQRPRPALYESIAENNRVLIKALTSKHHAFAFVPNGWVYDQTSPVFAFDDWWSFGVLQSDIHRSWAMAFGASLETRPRYTPSDCFETFPFPLRSGDKSDLSDVAEEYHVLRQEVMKSNECGLTSIYNKLHNSEDNSDGLERLRIAHVNLAEAATKAYGWNDLDLGFGFHITKQGARFTFNEEARQEIIQRLLRLNHERYEEEVRQGLHNKKKSKKKKTKAAPERKKKATAQAATLFPDGD